MQSILIKTDSHYNVNRPRIRKLIENFLSEKRVKGKIEISMSVVGDRAMRLLNKKYRLLDETTDVLSFPLNNTAEEKPFIDPPDNVLYLGDIIISYPMVLEAARTEDKLVDDVIDGLVIHGLNHLLGQHH